VTPFQSWLEENYPDEEVLTMDGFDEAIIGVTQTWPNKDLVAVYARDICLQVLERDMTREEAEEYFDFNVAGAYVGKQTPLILDRFGPKVFYEVGAINEAAMNDLKLHFKEPSGMITVEYPITWVPTEEANAEAGDHA
jgi:hypothetical protein